MKKSHVPDKERETSSFNFNVFSNYQVLYLSHYGPRENKGHEVFNADSCCTSLLYNFSKPILL